MEAHVSNILYLYVAAYVPTPPTPQRQAVADPRQPARHMCHSICCYTSHRLRNTATVSYSYTVSRKEKFSDFKWF